MANYISQYSGSEIDSRLTAVTSKQDTITANGLLKGDGSGNITVATSTDLPNIDASKITTGTLATAQIPSLSASKITSGQFADSRISSASTWNSKSAKSQVITCQLTVNGWVDNQQPVTEFQGGTIEANGYSYIVSPQPSSFSDYATCQVRALDVTTDGQMTFVRSSAGENAINVSILKCEVS